MLFPTAEYGIFFLCVFAVAWSLRRHLRAHKALLLVASYGFYSFWDWRLLPVLVGISWVAAIIGRALQIMQDPRRRKLLVAGGIALALGLLGAFKYLGFAVAGVLNLLELLGVQLDPPRLPEVALPVGISFFVFHAISLMVDAYRGRIPVRVNWLDAALYVAFFPQLIAGPILRANRFLPQLAKAPDPDQIDVSRALGLIAGGLAKKVLIANFLATRLVDPVFESFATHSALEAALAAYGYAVQIYCDFSGYSDIAIGSALLLGYQIPENFDAPYLASNLREFWRCWHISLSSWLRDYLFIPLGGSRKGRWRTLTNIGITMLLGGLWHGAAWNFVAWGALHGLGLIIHRVWAETPIAWIQRVRTARIWQTIAALLTFHFVCLAWVLFRAPSMESISEFVAALSHWSIGTSVSTAVLLAIVAGLIGQVFPIQWREVLYRRFAKMPLTLQGLAFALSILVIEVLGPQGIAPFIYFQF